MLTARKIIEALSQLTEEEKDKPFLINFYDYFREIGKKPSDTLGDLRVGNIQLYLIPSDDMISVYFHTECKENKDFYIDRDDLPPSNLLKVMQNAKIKALKLWKSQGSY